jgi:hypothetical protein
MSTQRATLAVAALGVQLNLMSMELISIRINRAGSAYTQYPLWLVRLVGKDGTRVDVGRRTA